VNIAVSGVAFLMPLLLLWSWRFLGAGKLGVLLPGIYAETAVNVSLSVALIYRLSILGPVLATLIAQLAVPVWWIPGRLKSHFGLPRRVLLRSCAGPLVGAVVYAAGLLQWTQGHAVTHWVGLLGEMGLAALAYFAFAYAFLLHPEERDFLKEIAGKVLRRSRL
jgi:hypothetical protein